MVAHPPTELIELDVEQLSFVPGSGVDRLGGARRWWDAAPPAVTVRPASQRSVPAAGAGATTVLTGNTSFWRILDVPGDELGRVLGTWWTRSRHDDGRLRLGPPRGINGAWYIGGSMRVSFITRRFAVDVRLASYAHYWTMLELSPRRPIRPTRIYFRVGHDSLDLFAAALRELA